MLYLRFVRSPFAHARIVSVDTSAAESLPGVVCALTGKEIAAQTQPFIEIGPEHAQKIRDFPMAVGKALYQGEPVAAVVAESPSLADDAAELVQVEYEPLEPVVEAERRLLTRAFSTKKRARTGCGMGSGNTATWSALSKTRHM